MNTLRPYCVTFVVLLAAGAADAQLPATQPTSSVAAPLAASAVPSTAGSHRAEVSCTNGQLEVRAQNSSLNQILRSIAACTGMRITGGVNDQRVFGDYGPAAPATVLATLLDGTGSNMLLRETALDQPAELILTPRTGGPTPPPPSSYNESNDEASQRPAAGGANPGAPPSGMPGMMMRGPRNQMLPPSQQDGSGTSGPASIPQPTNNVNGNPANSSPTASTYPTTNSVPLDAVRTPSTTPPASGIVDAPNPPPAGSDTAAAMNGAPAGTPGTTNINPGATSGTTTPGATNTTTPAQNSGTDSSGSTTLTPEQIYQQLQQLQQQREQQQKQQQQPSTPQL